MLKNLSTVQFHSRQINSVTYTQFDKKNLGPLPKTRRNNNSAAWIGHCLVLTSESY